MKKTQATQPLISFDLLEGVEIAVILQDNVKNVKDSHLAIVWIGMISPQVSLKSVPLTWKRVGATDNDGVHWALLGARKHHVVLPSKCQGGLALLPGQQPAQATSGLPRVQPVTTGVPALAPLTITLCLIRGWICFLNTGLWNLKCFPKRYGTQMFRNRQKLGDRGQWRAILGGSSGGKEAEGPLGWQEAVFPPKWWLHGGLQMWKSKYTLKVCISLQTSYTSES